MMKSRVVLSAMKATACTGIALGLMATPIPAVAKNEFMVVADEMTDAKQGLAVMNFGGEVAVLARCDTNGPDSLYIVFSSQAFLGERLSRYSGLKTPAGKAYNSAKVRFDGKEPYDVKVVYGKTAASVASLKPGSEGERLLLDLANSKRIALELRTYDFEPIQTSFDLEDAASVIKQAATTCGDASILERLAASSQPQNPATAN
jgi:hypothetical protein